MDLLAITGALALLLGNVGIALFLGQYLRPIPIRIEEKDLSRKATERMFRKNLGLDA